MKGICQKAISAKLDYEVLEAMEMEREVTGMTRNRMLNVAVMTYCDLQDTIRRMRCAPSQDMREEFLRDFLRIHSGLVF